MTKLSANTFLVEHEITRLAIALINDIPDAVIYADRDGIIQFWNAGAARIFGFLPEEALGQNLDIIIPTRLRQRHWDGYRHMMETGLSRHGPEELLSTPAQTKLGATISIQFTVTPVLKEDETIVGIVALLRDVTATFQELKRLRAQPQRSG